MSPDTQRYLLARARCAISNAFAASVPRELEPPGDSVLTEKRGVFVTLHRDGQLRGCMGCLTSDVALEDAVCETARTAAFRDPRFPPLEATELGRISLSISVLSPLESIRGPQDLKIGKHGILIRKGIHSGTYLPGVASEMRWNAEEFVQHCSQEKAGLGPDGWREAQLFRYGTEEIREEESLGG